MTLSLSFDEQNFVAVAVCSVNIQPLCRMHTRSPDLWPSRCPPPLAGVLGEGVDLPDLISPYQWNSPHLTLAWAVRFPRWMVCVAGIFTLHNGDSPAGQRLLKPAEPT